VGRAPKRLLPDPYAISAGALTMRSRERKNRRTWVADQVGALGPFGSNDEPAAPARMRKSLTSSPEPSLIQHKEGKDRCERS